MASIFKRKAERNSKGSRWVIKWRDAESGKWRNQTGYTDKEASIELGEVVIHIRHRKDVYQKGKATLTATRQRT